MLFRPISIEGVRLIELTTHRDARGSFARTFCVSELAEAGIPFQALQGAISRNPRPHTLRGMHAQTPPHDEAKLVYCSHGRIWDVVVDMREGSPTYRSWQGFHLGRDDDAVLFIPRGLAHGFLTLEPDSEVSYLMDATFAPGAAVGIRWNDPAIGIAWPAEPAMISERDATFPLLAPAASPAARPG